MFQLERDAEFLSETRARLNASEEWAAEQQFRDWKSFLRGRVCQEFSKLLGLVLSASRSDRVHLEKTEGNIRCHVPQAIRSTLT